jgi:hypothetical protein
MEMKLKESEGMSETDGGRPRMVHIEGRRFSVSELCNKFERGLVRESGRDSHHDDSYGDDDDNHEMMLMMCGLIDRCRACSTEGGRGGRGGGGG